MRSSLALREQVAKLERIGPSLLTADSVLDGALGGIEKGMRADLVIVDANPLGPLCFDNGYSGPSTGLRGNASSLPAE